MFYLISSCHLSEQRQWFFRHPLSLVIMVVGLGRHNLWAEARGQHVMYPHRVQFPNTQLRGLIDVSSFILCRMKQNT